MNARGCRCRCRRGCRRGHRRGGGGGGRSGGMVLAGNQDFYWLCLTGCPTAAPASAAAVGLTLLPLPAYVMNARDEDPALIGSPNTDDIPKSSPPRHPLHPRTLVLSHIIHIIYLKCTNSPILPIPDSAGGRIPQ